MKAHTAYWLKARIANPKITDKEIAAELGISPSTLKNTIYKARREGWLEFTNPLDDLKYGMSAKVADNLNLFLDARDKQVTLEVAKATIFAEHAKESGLNTQPAQSIFALQIVVPEGIDVKAAAANIKGTIVAKPVSFDTHDAEVIDIVPSRDS